jgi:hypothetical protein
VAAVLKKNFKLVAVIVAALILIPVAPRLGQKVLGKDILAFLPTPKLFSEDVYVAGYEKHGDKKVAIVWKNSTAQLLSDGSFDAEAHRVFVSGSNVYVAGYEKNAENKAVATVWKNGAAQRLTNGDYNAEAKSVFVLGNDVYVAGYEDKPYAAYAITGMLMSTVTPATKITGMKVDAKMVARLWKNGVAQPQSADLEHEKAVPAQAQALKGLIGVWKGNIKRKKLSGKTKTTGRMTMVVYEVGGGYKANVDIHETITGEGRPYERKDKATMAVSFNQSAKNWPYDLDKVESLSSNQSHFWGKIERDVFIGHWEGRSDEYYPEFRLVKDTSSEASRLLAQIKNEDKDTSNAIYRPEMHTPFNSSSYDILFVSGNDVYTAGREAGQTATLWKNGDVQYRIGKTLKDFFDKEHYAEAKSVFVSGNDLYVAGYEPINTKLSAATVWKNGTAQYLTDGKYDSSANSIFVSGSDVYVAGYEKSPTVTAEAQAKAQRNQVTGSLAGGAVGGLLLGPIGMLAGAAVGSAGSPDRNPVATIWINGKPQRLSDGSYSAEAKSVFVSGSNVYAAGMENEGGRSVATIWKNGTAQRLTDGNAEATANSVFVK